MKLGRRLRVYANDIQHLYVISLETLHMQVHNFVSYLNKFMIYTGFLILVQIIC